MAQTQAEARLRSRLWLKLALFSLCGLAILVALNIGFAALNTLSRLDAVESARDQWQRPAEVIRALNLKPGDSVADIGCGAGYFSLKLSSVVGRRGQVIAEDIRRLPLSFLLIRSLGKRRYNLHVVSGGPEDPHLSAHAVNAVLISNAYHEFTNPASILGHVAQSLVPGGLLVIVDHGPESLSGRGSVPSGHGIAAEKVATDLRNAGFQVIRRSDNFIETDPEDQTWWLIIAQHLNPSLKLQIA